MLKDYQDFSNSPAMQYRRIVWFNDCILVNLGSECNNYYEYRPYTVCVFKSETVL